MDVGNKGLDTIVSDKIIERLETMTEMAKKMPCQAEIRNLAEEYKYIRLGGNGLMAVSLHWQKPLKGYSETSVKRIDTIRSHFEKNAKMPGSNVPEHRLQGWIIREALINNRNLKVPFQMNNCEFDELIFALDEVSIGGTGYSVNNLRLSDRLINAKDAVRCDVLAVGRKGDHVFPVVIELKVDRKEKRLHDQLNNFAKLMVLFEIQFVGLLNEVIKDTGLKLSNISKDTIRKIMVWPVSESGHVRTDTGSHNEKGFDLLEYKPEILHKQYPPVDSFKAHVSQRLIRPTSEKK